MRKMEVLAPGIADALRFPDHVDARVLAAGVNETHTVPTGAAYVLFSATGDFYVSYDGDAATIPAADVTDGTASELNPTIRYIAGVAELDLIAPLNTVVTMSFYKA